MNQIEQSESIQQPHVYAQPLSQKVALVQESLARLHARSGNDPDLMDVLVGLTEIVDVLARYRWT